MNQCNTNCTMYIASCLHTQCILFMIIVIHCVYSYSIDLSPFIKEIGKYDFYNS